MRRTTPVLSTAAVVCGLLLIAPLPAHAADLGTVSTTAELRTQIAVANANADADVITLAAGGSFVLGGAAGDEGDADPATGDLDVTGALTIDGNGATIDGSAVDRVLDVLSGSLTLIDVTIVNGNAPDAENGGAVRVAAGASLVVTGGAMADNEATNAGAVAATAGSGGAIATAGTTTVTGTTFSGNDATRAGGAVEVLGTGAATVTGSTFTGNTTTTNAPGNGGGLHITGAGTAVVTGSELRTNTAAEGGALWNSAGGTLTVTDTDIVDNTATGAAADQGGGGVFTEGGRVAISGGTIQSNQATGAAGSGGGILNVNGTVAVTGTEVTDNTAERAGGGIEAGPLLTTTTPPVTGSTAPTTTTLDGVLLQGNSFTGVNPDAPRNGAGLHLTGAGTVAVTGSDVLDNTGAREGGGLWNSATGVLTVTNSDISGNSTDGALADQGGGGVFTEGGDVVITGSVITSNTSTGAGASGGGILNITGDVRVSDTTIAYNAAVRAGGGVEAGPLLDVPTATPPIVGRADATNTELTRVLLLGNAVTGPPGNGGGLHLTGAGDVVVESSSVAGNTAVEGGGLWNSAAGTTTVLDSTVSNNTATGPDGGGGLYNDGGDLAAVNVTVVDNDAANGAGGGVLSTGGTAGLLHATVTGNSTGVSGPVEIANTVLTENDAADAADGVTSLGGNVLSAALPSAPLRQPGANDTTGVTDPRLATLDSVVDGLPTRLPLAGSPAIDAGVTVDTTGATPEFIALVGSDQLGVARPLDGNGDGRAVVDAGAVEAPAVAPAPGGGGVTPPARPVPAQPNYTG